MYVLYSAIGILVLACVLNIAWYAYRRHRVEVRLNLDNMHNNMLRQDLIDRLTLKL